MPCHILVCPLLSFLLLACTVLSCLDMLLSCPSLVYGVFFSHVLFCHAFYFPTPSNPVLLGPTLPHDTITYPPLSPPFKARPVHPVRLRLGLSSHFLASHHRHVWSSLDLFFGAPCPFLAYNLLPRPTSLSAV